jgi:hypothetical protein
MELVSSKARRTSGGSASYFALFMNMAKAVVYMPTSVWYFDTSCSRNGGRASYGMPKPSMTFWDIAS